METINVETNQTTGSGLTEGAMALIEGVVQKTNLTDPKETAAIRLRRAHGQISQRLTGISPEPNASGNDRGRCSQHYMLFYF